MHECENVMHRSPAPKSRGLWEESEWIVGGGAAFLAWSRPWVDDSGGGAGLEPASLGKGAFPKNLAFGADVGA